MASASSPVPVIIAIELGKFECRVGAFRNGQVEIFQDDNGDADIPSWIYFKEEDGERVFGSVAKELGVVHMERSIRAGLLVDFLDARCRPKTDAAALTSSNEIGKLLGLKFVDMFGKLGVSVEVAGQKRAFYLEQVVAMLLGRMKEIAEKKLGTEVTEAVLIIPAGGFHSILTHNLRQCATIAGFANVGFLSRCHAALIWNQFKNSADDEEHSSGSAPRTGAKKKKNSFIKVIDFAARRISGADKHTTSVADFKEGVLKEVFTSTSTSDKVPSILNGVLPDTWILIEAPSGGVTPSQRALDLEGCEKATTVSKLTDPACILSGAAVYAGTMINKNDYFLKEEGRLELKPAFPKCFWLFDTTNEFTTIICKDSLFGEKQKAVIRAPILNDGSLFLKIFEVREGRFAFGRGIDENGFGLEIRDLGNIQIYNFETRQHISNVEVTFQITYNGSFDVTAKCEWTGEPCNVVFGDDWFSHSFSKERLEALRLQELILGSKTKMRRGENPAGSSSGGGDSMMELTVEEPAGSGSRASSTGPVIDDHHDDDDDEMMGTPSSSQATSAYERHNTASGTGGQIQFNEMGLVLMEDEQAWVIGKVLSP